MKLPENKYYLPCHCANQQSFGHKAIVEVNGDEKILYSYLTPVAKIVNGDFFKLYDCWSLTTGKHINSFRIDEGLKAISKKEWQELEVSV